MVYSNKTADELIDDEQLLINKAADEKEKSNPTTHSLKQVWYEFKHYLKRPNRYRESLVPVYKSPLPVAA